MKAAKTGLQLTHPWILYTLIDEGSVIAFHIDEKTYPATGNPAHSIPSYHAKGISPVFDVYPLLYRM